jgi:hypothetical protein
MQETQLDSQHVMAGGRREARATNCPAIHAFRPLRYWEVGRYNVSTGTERFAQRPVQPHRVDAQTSAGHDDFCGYEPIFRMLRIRTFFFVKKNQKTFAL